MVAIAPHSLSLIESFTCSPCIAITRALPLSGLLNYRYRAPNDDVRGQACAGKNMLAGSEYLWEKAW